jgi:hypothetical protein
LTSVVRAAEDSTNSVLPPSQLPYLAFTLLVSQVKGMYGAPIATGLGF